MAYLVGIAGGSGSGKGTLADLIQKHLNLWDLKSFILSTDDCYKDLSYYSKEERDNFCFNRKFNFDHPNAIDFDRLICYAQKMKEGISFDYPKYDFKIHTYGAEKVNVPEKIDVAIIEGIYALYSGSKMGTDTSKLINIYDHRLFVVTDPKIAQNRRILRDVEERGRDIKQVIKQLNLTVFPMYEKYIGPTHINADDIVDWRTDETKDKDVANKQLVELARQRALTIYENAIKPVLPRLDDSSIKIF